MRIFILVLYSVLNILFIVVTNAISSYPLLEIIGSSIVFVTGAFGISAFITVVVLELSEVFK